MDLSIVTLNYQRVTWVAGVSSFHGHNSNCWTNFTQKFYSPLRGDGAPRVVAAIRLRSHCALVVFIVVNRWSIEIQVGPYRWWLNVVKSHVVPDFNGIWDLIINCWVLYGFGYQTYRDIVISLINDRWWVNRNLRKTWEISGEHSSDDGLCPIQLGKSWLLKPRWLPGNHTWQLNILPSGYLTVRHGIDGPFIDDFPS